MTNKSGITKLKSKILKDLVKRRNDFFESTATESELKSNKFSKYAMPMIRCKLPKLTASGDHAYSGKIKTLDEVDFGKLIPENEYKSYDELEKWYKKAFEEQNIDSSIRKEVLKILSEFIDLPIEHIHGDGIIGVQPMTDPVGLIYSIRYSNKSSNSTD